VPQFATVGLAGGFWHKDVKVSVKDKVMQILPLKATSAGTNQFGQYYEIRGALRGTKGVVLHVKTIWMREHLSEVTRFINLLPDKLKAL
jgi:hypothetical protein